MAGEGEAPGGSTALTSEAAPDPAVENATVVGGEGEDTAKGGESTVRAGDTAESGDTQEGDTAEGGEKNELHGAPEGDYEDWTLPENFEITDPALAEEFGGLAKELDLSQAGAQKLVDFHLKQVEKNAEAVANQWQETGDKWLKDARADKEIGGQKFQDTVERGKRALKQFGTPELVEMVETYKLGNHPEFLRLMARVDEATGEDDVSKGGRKTVEKPSVGQSIWKTNPNSD